MDEWETQTAEYLSFILSDEKNPDRGEYSTNNFFANMRPFLQEYGTQNNSEDYGDTPEGAHLRHIGTRLQR